MSETQVDYLEDTIASYESFNIVEFFKKELVYQLDNINMNEIRRLAMIIYNGMQNKKNIFISGIGKSGNICEYLCGILQSINIPIHKINLMNSSHGDIGLCKEGDIILFLSKSGNTTEIIDKIHCFTQKSVRTIGICCNEDSLFAKECDDCIILPLGMECPGVIQTIPTSSILSQTLFGCILCDELMKMTNITLDEYKQNHPAGNIGKNNASILDVMLHTGFFPLLQVNDDIPIKLNEITTEMLKYSMGICVFTNTNNTVIGIITDGDIRRKFIQNSTIQQSELNTDFYYETDVNKLLLNIKNIQYIPILKDTCIIGMIKRM